MNILINIGIKIRALRKQKGLSQEKLAHLANVDRTYIPKVEKGEINMTLNSLAKIAKALEVDINVFFE